MFNKLNSKKEEDIFYEWDALAQTRFRQISSGTDITYRQFLVPKMLELIDMYSGNSVLDVGCGVGYLTNLISNRVPQVVGIDPSPESIKIAQENYGKNVKFICDSLSSYNRNEAEKFDTVIANMVLMDVVDLDSFVCCIRESLLEGGKFIFSVTHPENWPKYCGYDTEPWYQYNKELIVEGPFKITNEVECPLYSTHVHRPISLYLDTFEKGKFSVLDLVAPMPESHVMSLYSKVWMFPRYLFGVCVK